jgi:hypothetical protein
VWATEKCDTYLQLRVDQRVPFTDGFPSLVRASEIQRWGRFHIRYREVPRFIAECLVIMKVGRAMAQAVSRLPLNADIQVRARVSPCEICGGQTGAGTDYSRSYSGFPCQYYSTVALHTHVSSGGWTVGPLVAAVQRRGIAPSMLWSWPTGFRAV